MSFKKHIFKNVLNEDLPGDYDFHTVSRSGVHNIKHQEYMEYLKTLDVPALKYIIKDATQAARANPDNPKSGVYEDQAHYAAMELKSRQQNDKNR